MGGDEQVHRTDRDAAGLELGPDLAVVPGGGHRIVVEELEGRQDLGTARLSVMGCAERRVPYSNSETVTALTPTTAPAACALRMRFRMRSALPAEAPRCCFSPRRMKIRVSVSSMKTAAAMVRTPWIPAAAEPAWP